MRATPQRSIPYRILRGLALSLLLLFGLLALDYSPRLWNKVTPPEKLQTIDEFRHWLNKKNLREGTYQNADVLYTVLIGNNSSLLGSGPTAYVFDSTGTFVDWTSDMGDYYTIERHFDLTSGNVKFSP